MRGANPRERSRKGEWSAGTAAMPGLLDTKVNGVRHVPAIRTARVRVRVEVRVKVGGTARAGQTHAGEACRVRHGMADSLARTQGRCFNALFTLQMCVGGWRRSGVPPHPKLEHVMRRRLLPGVASTGPHGYSTSRSSATVRRRVRKWANEILQSPPRGAWRSALEAHLRT